MESKTMSEPKSLQEAIIYFSNPDNCIDYLAIRRWPNGKVVCPTCGSEKVKFSDTRRTWTCSSHHSKREFSIKVGTVMEDSAIGLDKWLTAMWLVTNCKNGISSYEVSRDLKVMDGAAIALARDNGLPVIVFSIEEAGNLLKVLRGEGRVTVIEGSA